jgi:stage V sporulation protein G
LGGAGEAPERQDIMQITDVRIRTIPDESKLKAVVSVTFDDEFVVHDIKIIDGQNGLFIAMPSRKVGEGDFRDIAHPLTSEVRSRIKDAIFKEYDRLQSESEPSPAPAYESPETPAY